jgi:hypothetical protein
MAKDPDIWCIEKIWKAVQLGNGLLGLVRQAMVTSHQSIEKATLQGRASIGERAQSGKVGRPVTAARAGQGTAAHEVQQGLAQAMTVELQGFELIVETHQALITGCLALRFEVVPLFVKVAAQERLPGDAGEGIGFPTSRRNTPTPPSVSRRIFTVSNGGVQSLYRREAGRRM